MPVSVYPPSNAIKYADSPNLDAFGRLRTSQPFGVFDNKQIHSEHNSQFEIVTAGGGTATYQYDRSSTSLDVGTASGDRALRQTIRYFPYIPGKSNLLTITGIFDTGKANVDQYIGYGDDLNGLFFKYQGTTFGTLLRSSVSGSVVDTFTPQSSWNKDTLDGEGPSGKTLDITKVQIFLIDFEWLGVGRVRYSLQIDGEIILVHEILNANNADAVYMKTPTLPVRWEIINTGTSASASDLESICSSVASEGGYNLPGLESSVTNGVTTRSVNTTRIPILAIRLKSAFPTGEPNRITARFLRISVSTQSQDVMVELAHEHNPSAITANWIDIGPHSGAEYSKDITAITGSPTHIVESFNAVSGQGSTSGTADLSSEFINAHSFISQNFDSTNSQAFVVYATAFTGTAQVSSHLSSIEFE